MFADFTTPAELSFRTPSIRRLMMRMAAIVMAAEARAKERRDYARLMECDDAMRDVGVTRDDVRRALMELDGRG